MTSAYPWPAIVLAAQMLSALTWLATAHHYFPSTLRVLRGVSRNGWDAAGCWAWAMGMCQAGFTARWVFLGSADVRKTGGEFQDAACHLLPR